MTTPSSSASLRGRVSNPGRRLFIGTAFACVAGFADVALAQDAIDPVVLIVDMQRVQRDSAAARSVREQSTALRLKIKETIGAREAAIRAEEEELADLREELERDAFRERVQLFEAKVFEARDYAQAETAKLQAALSEASNRLRSRVAPILAELMKEKKAQVMLDSAQVILSVNGLDITEEVIERLDAALPTMALSLDTAPQ